MLRRSKNKEIIVSKVRAVQSSRFHDKANAPGICALKPSGQVVVAADMLKRLYALKDQVSGRCAVFSGIDGPALSHGDLLEGTIRFTGQCTLQHRDGQWTAKAHAGPLSCMKAVLLVNGAGVPRQEGA